MFKKIYRACLFLMVMVLSIFSCGCFNKKDNPYGYENIRITNVTEQTENYVFYFTVENITNEDITVFPRIFLKNGGMIHLDGQKIPQGGSAKFYCNDRLGRFYENPRGIIGIYDSNGNAIEIRNFEFKV